MIPQREGSLARAEKAADIFDRHTGGHPMNGAARAGSRVPYGTVVAILVWMAAVAWGMLALWSYSTAPGQEASAPESWPEHSSIPRDPGRAALVLFAHPRCACTRASLDELARLLARAGDRVSASVVFLSPQGVAPEWSDTSLVRGARTIPGLHVVEDPEGREARRFGAATSGQTLLYDDRGWLRFSGGITFARAHEGDNAGEDAIRSFLLAGVADRDRSPVFGCALADERGMESR